MAKIAKKYPVTIERGIIQRGECSFRVKIMRSGNLVNKSFDTLAEARIFRDLTLANAALDPNEQATFEARARRVESKAFTFKDSIDKYRTDKSEKKKGWKQEASMLDKLLRWPRSGTPLYQIKAGDVTVLLEWVRVSGKAANKNKGCSKAANKNKKIVTKLKPTQPASESTLRRYFNLIRHIFEVAVTEWKKIDTNPCSAIPKSARPKDGQGRDRRLRGDEYDQLMYELTGEAKIIIILAIETAMRRGEVMKMRWEHLNLTDRWLLIPKTKTETARTIPLSLTAVAAFKALPAEGIKGRIITISVIQLRHAFQTARVKIGAPDLRIHDLRHEATSRLFEKGFGDIEAATVTGHKTMAMLKRYTHLKQSHLLEKLDRKIVSN